MHGKAINFSFAEVTLVGRVIFRHLLWCGRACGLTMFDMDVQTVASIQRQSKRLIPIVRERDRFSMRATTYTSDVYRLTYRYFLSVSQVGAVRLAEKRLRLIRWSIDNCQTRIYRVSQLPRFSDIFPTRLGILSPNFTRVLHVPVYVRIQLFVQLPATLTTLCHSKCDHHHVLKMSTIGRNARWVVALNMA